jgi:hypothetical protein
LKQPKKAEKDLSAEDIAFQQKQKVSKQHLVFAPATNAASILADTFCAVCVQADAAALKALKGQLGDKGFVKAKVGGKK